jgi:PKD repeat protein
VLNFVFIANATEAIYCDNSNITLTNSIISYNLLKGIYIKNSSPFISNNRIENNGNMGLSDAGIYADNSYVTIENCSILNSDPNDFILFGTSNITSLNSTFDDNKVLGSGSSYIFSVRWYLDVWITEDDEITPIPDASVIVENISGAPIPGSPFNTDVSGYVRWLTIIEYERIGSPTKIFHTPHDITASHPEYYTGSTDPEPFISTSMQVQVNLTMILRDLTTNFENITFDPNGIPVAFENLQVQARIHNIEIDNASDVRVVIEDDAPEAIIEIYNVTFSKIKGYDFEEAIKIWQPTPGIHTITVLIDPFNTIAEENSNPLIFAEENNNVSVPLNVNARPWVNITDPKEGNEINGTININGKAFDDPRDDTWDITNNVSRVDIRLVDYDWIQLTSPFFLTPEISTGYWNWQYDWDTTQWDDTPIPDGNYTLQARAWDGYHYSFIYETNIMVNNTGGNQAPVVIINEPINNTAYSVNETITFNGSLSYDPDGDPLIFTWDFDDGNFGSGNVTTHSFSQKGMYNVSLTVNDGQVSNTTYVTVIIDNTPPYAEVTSSTDTAYVNETITFFGYNSTDEETPELLEYFWDFDDTRDTDGDGNFTNDVDFFSTYPIENATYAYTQSGSYTVTLRVWDGRINNSDTVTIEILENAAPTAVISEPISGQYFSVNETIFFNASASSDPNDADLEYFWDFGDGTNSSWLNEPTTTHFYLEYGPNNIPVFRSYTVILEVRDAGGLSDSTFVYVGVNNYPPVANATSNVTTSPTYMDITFDGSNSDDQDSPTLTYLWDFDDGNTSSDEITSHQFANDGVYNVTLIVTDTEEANDTDWIIITITNRDPVIDNVTISPSQPIMDEEITFNVTATDDDGIIVEYKWNFGDNTEYTEIPGGAPDGTFDGKTTHSYPSKDSYLVTITVKDDDGAYNSTQIWVDIANTPPNAQITYPNEEDQVSDLVSIEGTSDDVDGSVSKVEVRSMVSIQSMQGHMTRKITPHHLQVLRSM